MGITFWLVPPAESAEQLQRIAQFRPPGTANASSPRLNDDTTYPKFGMHVTLAAIPSSVSFPLTTLRAAIPALGSPVNCELDSLRKGSHYFRSVYLAIKPSTELDSLHDRIHSALSLEPRTPSFPHLSLCYISDEDARHGERERYYDGLKASGMVREDVDGLSLKRNTGGWFSDFAAHEIWIVKCDGPVESWKVLDKIALVRK